MAKSNPIGVRFDLDMLEQFKEAKIADSPQKALNFLADYYLKNRKIVKLEPPDEKYKAIFPEYFENNLKAKIKSDVPAVVPIVENSTVENIEVKAKHPSGLTDFQKYQRQKLGLK